MMCEPTLALLSAYGDRELDLARHGLHFDQSRQKGIVFHMVNGVGEEEFAPWSIGPTL
jgi:hypothetical protein